MSSGHSAVDKWVISGIHSSRTENNYLSDLEYKELTSLKEFHGLKTERERRCVYL